MLVRLVTGDPAGIDGAGFQAAYQAVCTAGYVWSDMSAACVPCSAGSFSAYAASPQCTPCPAGSYAPLPGAAQCTACPAYSDTRGATGQYLLQACACWSASGGGMECRSTYSSNSALQNASAPWVSHPLWSP